MTRSLADSLPGHSPEQWAKDFLTGLGAPATPLMIGVVTAWERAESGGGGGLNNPLNTTEKGYGGSSFNSVGVQNYPTYADGLQASIATFSSGIWGPVQAALQAGDPAATQQAVNAAYATWGGGPIDILGGGAPSDSVTGPAGSPTASDPGNPTATGNGDPTDHCLISAPSVKVLGIGAGGGCLFSTSNGRAWLGGLSITGGMMLMLAGLGFVAVGGRTLKVTA